MNIILTFNKFCPLTFQNKKYTKHFTLERLFHKLFYFIVFVDLHIFLLCPKIFFFILSVNIRKHHEISCLIYSDQINRLFNRQSVVENFHEHEIRKI